MGGAVWAAGQQAQPSAAVGQQMQPYSSTEGRFSVQFPAGDIKHDTEPVTLQGSDTFDSLRILGRVGGWERLLLGDVQRLPAGLCQ